MTCPSRMRAYGFFLCVCATGLSGGGCRGRTGPAPAPSATGPDASASVLSKLTADEASRVLARVGDRTIALGDFAAVLDQMTVFDRMRYQAPQRRAELLEELVNTELLAQEAERQGYDKDPIATQEEREILRDAVLARVRAGAPAPEAIDAAEVRAYYEQHKEDFQDPERRRVSAIVARDKVAATDVLRALPKGATDAQFGEAVRAHSLDKPGVDIPVDLAGDLGIVGPPGLARGGHPKVPEPVRAAAFALQKVGDVAPAPVASEGRFYVVRLTQILAPRERPIAEAERPIRVRLAEQKVRAVEEDYARKLRDKYPVKVNDAAVAALAEEMKGR